jgi:trimeric autotransporter adhesin
MKLVSSKSIGKRRVYDIEVEGVHNFFANGVNVHNCATAGGVSVIKNDGTVVNSSSTAGTSSVWIYGASRLAYNPSGTLLLGVDLSGIAGGFSGTTGISAGTSDFSVSYGPKLAGSGSVLASGGGDPFMSLTQLNHSNIKKGMTTRVTNTYNSGWQVGDSRLAALADTTAETITASGELVTNGDGSSLTSWTNGSTGTATAVASGGVFTLTNGTPYSANAARIEQGFTTVAGKTYTVTATITGTSFCGVWDSASSTGLLSNSAASRTGYVSFNFVANDTNSFVAFGLTNVDAAVCTIDNISVKLADPDRSVKNNGLVLNGTLTKTAVATGAGLVAYSGFSASNYLEQPYNANLDFGTGDFCVMGWVNVFAGGTQYLLDRGLVGGSTPRFSLLISSNRWFYASVASTTATVDTGISATVGLHLVGFGRTSGTLFLDVDGVRVYSIANTVNLTNTSATLRVGEALEGGAFFTLGSMALWRISATAPSADQIAHIYRTELPLFQAGAQCTIAGTSTAVTALAYDDVADTLQVGTSWGRTAFRDLLRIDSEATTTGAITSLSANEGAVITGGASSAKVYAPAMYLRDELRRKEIARKALGRVPSFFDYTATASQIAFVAPKGFTIKALYKNGTLMRETTTGVYWTRSNDGFQETATLSVGATVSDWISIMCVRV